MPEIVAVPDSGPLIALARIHQLDLLPRMFDKVVSPPEVWNEVTIKGKGLPGASKVAQVNWLIIEVPEPHLVLPLSILVDAGEAQAIALAQTISDCIILLDDARARKIAGRLKIKQIGTIGLLLRAKRMGLIRSIKPSIEALIDNGIYIRKQLINAVLHEAGEFPL